MAGVETYEVSVCDFSFDLDLAQYFLPEPNGPPIWLRGDADPCLRGGVHQQVDNTAVPDGSGIKGKDLEAQYVGQGRMRTLRRRAAVGESIKGETMENQRNNWGLPIWASFPDQPPNTAACLESEDDRKRLRCSTHSTAKGWSDRDLAPPGKTLLDWADEYVRSKKLLKRFTFEKQVYGWNFEAVLQEVYALVQYNYARSGNVTVEFRNGMDRWVSIRADSWLSRMLDNSCVYILLWLVLIYPLIIWPFKRFGSRGGGEWNVAGTSYALTRLVHEPESTPGQTVEEYREQWLARWKEKNKIAEPPKGIVFQQTPLGVSRLHGIREGEWFSKWEDAIGAYVRRHLISNELIKGDAPPRGFPALGRTGGEGLDGWPGADPAKPPATTPTKEADITDPK